MFNPNQVVIDAFIADTINRYGDAFPSCELGYDEVLEEAARIALETLLHCDCPYHDLHHTLLVVDAGQTILQGRQLAQGDVSPTAWMHVVIALFFHDIGYVRGLLRDDTDGTYVTGESGEGTTPGPGATDASLMPYHVDRGIMFVYERFATHPLIEVPMIADYIEMTRFPVPDSSHYKDGDTFATLVRSADLIGQMGDPLYPRKLSRLHAEFVETGEAARLNYSNTEDLRAGYPEFFYEHVYPYLTEGLRFLSKTQEGQMWTANLFHHVHAQQNTPGMPTSSGDATPSRPHIAVSNR